jgi:hypothetical protein
MKIPKEFTLGAVTWKVKIVEDLPDRMGQSDFRNATILIEKNANKRVMEQTFCHELLHTLFFSTGRADNHDEVLIDGLGHSLHQYLVEIYDGK